MQNVFGGQTVRVTKELEMFGKPFAGGTKLKKNWFKD